MNEAVVVVDGVTYRGDAATRTIAPADDLSGLVAELLRSGEPLGGSDEFASVGTWDAYPLSMIAAFRLVADHDGLAMTWFSDEGQAPAGA